MVVGVHRQYVVYKIHAISANMITETAIERPVTDSAIKAQATSQELTFWLDVAIWRSTELVGELGGSG